VRSFSLLVNPTSGGGAAARAVVPVARALRDAGATVEVTWSSSVSAVPRLVADACARGDVVVSVGGDGMLSSLAGEVAARGGVLGMVPAGRGNDFARMLGVPSDADAAARVLLEAEPRPVDLLSWRSGDAGGERLVAGSVYAGVDARAAAIVDRVRWLPGPVQYPWAAVRSLATYRAGRYRVTVDGVTTEHDAATVVVANSGYYGKGMHVAPAARVDDGLLDVIVIGAASRWSLIRAMPRVYDGRHVDADEVTVLTGRRVELSGHAGIPVGGDGEPLGGLPGPDRPPAVAEVRPGVLAVLVL
jgi:YegS/Rv2252/BmrU family lipid kinase